MSNLMLYKNDVRGEGSYEDVLFVHIKLSSNSSQACAKFVWVGIIGPLSSVPYYNV